jgi:hypothetical protein
MLAGVIFTVASCKDDTNKNDCGCDSKNKTFVSDQTGILKKDSLSGSFYIYKLEPGPMYVFDIICNQEKVNIITPGSNVIYSGYRSAYCDSTQFSFGQTFKSNITISQILVTQ